jgi:hypothetical protein
MRFHLLRVSCVPATAPHMSSSGLSRGSISPRTLRLLIDGWSGPSEQVRGQASPTMTREGVAHQVSPLRLAFPDNARSASIRDLSRLSLALGATQRQLKTPAHARCRALAGDAEILGVDCEVSPLTPLTPPPSRPRSRINARAEMLPQRRQGAGTQTRVHLRCVHDFTRGSAVSFQSIALGSCRFPRERSRSWGRNNDAEFAARPARLARRPRQGLSSASGRP